MVCRCVAAGCSKTHKDSSLFQFPKDASLRKKWADQVRRTRADKWEPTARSVLCAMHFEQSCFEHDNKLSESMGLGKRKPRLKADAIPSIFERLSLKRTTPTAAPQPQKKARVAYEKRERSRVIKDFVGACPLSSKIDTRMYKLRSPAVMLGKAKLIKMFQNLWFVDENYYVVRTCHYNADTLRK